MGEREEKDSMGTVRIASDAYYGSQTQRALENFPISGLRPPDALVDALALIKQCAATVNRQLGLLDEQLADAIAQSCREVMAGALRKEMVVDVFQTGSGTSWNMNINEVVASRANELLTGRRGGKTPVHPNDHVNLGQSSNDVIPSSIHIAAWCSVRQGLIPAVAGLQHRLEEKAASFRNIQKIGRTHLQDAVPMTLGQEFSGYARQMVLSIERLTAVESRICELALGGTAIGTGLNTHPDFGKLVAGRIAEETGLVFREAENHFAAQAAQDAAVELSGALKTVAVSLSKIANDIRWLASGPRCGIGEIRIPALQPGSSIMPGKVNPVIPEVVLQVAAQVVGNDATIGLCGQGGNFELNVMLPVIAYNLLQSINLLTNAARVFSETCIVGIVADEAVCRGNIENSLALVTGLVPLVGYDRAAEIANRAYNEGKTIREIVVADGLISDAEMDRILEPDNPNNTMEVNVTEKKRYQIQTSCPQCGCSAVSHLSAEELKEKFGDVPNVDMECSACMVKYQTPMSEACPEWDQECKMKK